MEKQTTTPENMYDQAYYDEFMTFLEKYDDYNLPHEEVVVSTDPSLDTISHVLLTLYVILGCAAVIILLTGLSEKARSVSASWYVYSLTLEIVIFSLVFTPTAHSKNFEVSIYSICRLEDTRKSFGLLRNIHIIFINIEIAFTILMARKVWLKTALKRFIAFFGGVWLFAFIFSDMVLPSLQDSHCLDSKHGTEVALHVILNWLPGVVVLGLTIAIVLFYSKGCFLREVHLETHAEHPRMLSERALTHELRLRARAHEWLIFIILLNAQFLLLDLVLLYLLDEVVAVDHKNFWTFLYLTIIRELLRMALPLTFLAISQVRNALYEAVTKPKSLLAACRKREIEQDEEVLTMSGTAEQFV